MKTKTIRSIVGAAAFTAVSAVGLTIGTSAEAETVHTQDNWKVSDVADAGTVMWNDYKDSNHSYDLDDIWITDEAGDGKSARLKVYLDGKLVKTKHAYSGETKKAYFGNVSNYEEVSWEVCRWNNGHNTNDCQWGTFTE